MNNLTASVLCFLIAGNKISPYQQTATVNSNATITCYLSNSVWTFNDSSTIPVNAIIRNYASKSIIHLLNVNKENEGYYTCRGIGEANNTMYANARVVIQGMQYLYY